ncbi:hypothetical protein EH183_40660 [Streptomyces sp. CB01881]|nr:hypothetical protein EH183_40660 [Streptomyces sp. CB01881]
MLSRPGRRPGAPGRVVSGGWPGGGRRRRPCNRRRPARWRRPPWRSGGRGRLRWRPVPGWPWPGSEPGATSRLRRGRTSTRRRWGSVRPWGRPPSPVRGSA